MSEDIKVIKKSITEEWLGSVPQLSVFAQNKLYRIVGCTVIGIELVKLPKVDDYRPHFVIYPLWKNGLKNCLESPIILVEISNKKGLQFAIPYLQHERYFNEVIECLKRQIPILWSEQIELKTFLNLIDYCFNDILIKSNSAQQARLFELKFFSALYTCHQSQVQKVLKQIEQAKRNWSMQMFEMWFGNFDSWLEVLKEKVNNKEEFLKQIEENKQDKKLLNLKRSLLTT